MFWVLVVGWLLGIILTLRLFALLSNIAHRRAQGAGIVNHQGEATRHKAPSCTIWQNRFTLLLYNHPKRISRLQRLWELVTGFTIMLKVTPGGYFLMDADDYGALWQLRFPQNRVVQIVHVINSSPEPDGSYSEYDIRVPNTVSTAQQAVAWTFGLARSWTDYRPRVQT